MGQKKLQTTNRNLQTTCPIRNHLPSPQGGLGEVLKKFCYL